MLAKTHRAHFLGTAGDSPRPGRAKAKPFLLRAGQRRGDPDPAPDGDTVLEIDESHSTHLLKLTQASNATGGRPSQVVTRDS
jgi:hypothetical protein